jgi:hypothetical protein
MARIEFWRAAWRPFFGYVVALAWLVQSLAVAVVVLTDPEHSGLVLRGLAELTGQWVVALGVTGLAVHERTRERLAGQRAEGATTR